MTRGRPRARINIDAARRYLAKGWSVKRVADKLGVAPETLRARLSGQPIRDPDDAITRLEELRAAGHQPGCCCRLCAPLRQALNDAGLWRQAQ